MIDSGEINVRDMFPCLPDNCDVYIQMVQTTFNNNYRLYYFLDGNCMVPINPDMYWYRTKELCEALNFDEETTVIWLLKFGEFAPKFYSQLIKLVNPMTTTSV
jgi:hypothetical protein